MNRFERNVLEVLRARSNQLSVDLCESVGSRHSHSMYWYFLGPNLHGIERMLQRFARKGWVTEQYDRWTITSAGREKLDSLARPLFRLAAS